MTDRIIVKDCDFGRLTGGDELFIDVALTFPAGRASGISLDDVATVILERDEGSPVVEVPQLAEHLAEKLFESIPWLAQVEVTVKWPIRAGGSTTFAYEITRRRKAGPALQGKSIRIPKPRTN